MFSLQTNLHADRTMKAMNVLKFRVIKPSDLGKIQKFYIDNFYAHEPVFSSTPKLIPSRRDQNDIAECVKQGTSILCYRETHRGNEEIIGGLLAMPKKSSYVEELFRASEEEGNTKYGHYLRMLATLHKEADICKRYNVDQLFFTLMGTVDPKWRGNNICKRLLDESVALATDMGYKVYTTDCTSNYSDRICEKYLKMHKLVSLKYKDFVDENGKPHFNVPEPHQEVNTYAMTLPWPIKAFQEYRK
ncbi:arylalkylamine N-acetyltransferase-like 2 [Musca autumnalis]|uniref:arylalkylamine N-acetyltransferase-like 2 n=1 Tax=Musca autumnalis TaxID=221902 RepID=UPI003CEECAB0